MLPLRFQNPDAADVARVPANQEGWAALAPRNPRLERIGVVMNVVNDKVN